MQVQVSCREREKGANLGWPDVVSCRSFFSIGLVITFARAFSQFAPRSEKQQQWQAQNVSDEFFATRENFLRTIFRAFFRCSTLLAPWHVLPPMKIFFNILSFFFPVSTVLTGSVSVFTLILNAPVHSCSGRRRGVLLLPLSLYQRGRRPGLNRALL